MLGKVSLSAGGFLSTLRLRKREQAAREASRDEFHRKAMVVYREKDHEHPGFRHSIQTVAAEAEKLRRKVGARCSDSCGGASLGCSGL